MVVVLVTSKENIKCHLQLKWWPATIELTRWIGFNLEGQKYFDFDNGFLCRCSYDFFFYTRLSITLDFFSTFILHEKSSLTTYGLFVCFLVFLNLLWICRCMRLTWKKKIWMTEKISSLDCIFSLLGVLTLLYCNNNLRYQKGDKKITK